MHDNETAVLTVTLPASATEGDGTLTGAGTVTVSQAPAVNMAVALSSSDTSEVTVPATVTILAGQTSATFNVTIVNDTLIDGPQTATVTAHVQNWTDGSAALDVLDNDGWLTLQLPAEAWENAGTLSGAGRVTLGGTLGADLVVTLASSDRQRVAGAGHRHGPGGANHRHVQPDRGERSRTRTGPRRSPSRPAPRV